MGNGEKKAIAGKKKSMHKDLEKKSSWHLGKKTSGAGSCLVHPGCFHGVCAMELSRFCPHKPLINDSGPRIPPHSLLHTVRPDYSSFLVLSSPWPHVNPCSVIFCIKFRYPQCQGLCLSSFTTLSSLPKPSLPNSFCDPLPHSFSFSQLPVYFKWEVSWY